jgi:hypothetical protein
MITSVELVVARKQLIFLQVVGQGFFSKWEQNAPASASSDAHSFLYYEVQSAYSITIMD